MMNPIIPTFARGEPEHHQRIAKNGHVTEILIFDSARPSAQGINKLLADATKRKRRETLAAQHVDTDGGSLIANIGVRRAPSAQEKRELQEYWQKQIRERRARGSGARADDSMDTSTFPFRDDAPPSAGAAAAKRAAVRADLEREMESQRRARQQHESEQRERNAVERRQLAEAQTAEQQRAANEAAARQAQREEMRRAAEDAVSWKRAERARAAQHVDTDGGSLIANIGVRRAPSAQEKRELQEYWQKQIRERRARDVSHCEEKGTVEKDVKVLLRCPITHALLEVKDFV